MTEFTFYKVYSGEALKRMGTIYYSGKATPTQIKKYEAIRAGLLADLLMVYPGEFKNVEAPALYLQQAIESVIYTKNKEEQALNDRVHANMQTAHNQLENYK
jgi:hypothetical protein